MPKMMKREHVLLYLSPLHNFSLNIELINNNL